MSLSISINSYRQAVGCLQELGWFIADPKLENTLKLAALMGNPQHDLRFIHVAGTNGKGSTCAMLESIYRAAGLRTGLFTSPHLISFRERIQVDRQHISETKVVELVQKLHPLLERFSQDDHPTFFEAATIMALLFFVEQRCDLVIWETGFGGRLDATNIVTPLASVITNIALDHQQWLGDTLAKIAAEKAGIIKPGVPVITAADEPEALAVIEKIAMEKKAPLTVVNGRDAALRRPDSAARCPYPPLPGEHQRMNAALALATVEVLQSKIPVSDEAIRRGLSKVDWPGRLQLIQRPNGQKILLDGAHNVAGAKVLREALSSWSSIPRPAGLPGGTLKRELQQAGPGTGAPQKFTLILGVFEDKDWRHICETLAPLAARIFTVPVSSERSADARELAAACRAANPTAGIAACGSLREALEKTADDDFVVLTGSLYLVGEALELSGLSPANGGERALNEWTAKVPTR